MTRQTHCLASHPSLLYRSIHTFIETTGRIRRIQSSDLIIIEKRLKEVWTGFEANQHKILELDEEKHTRGLDIADQYDDLVMRVSRHLNCVQQASTSTLTKCDTGTGSGPMSTPPYNQTPPSSPQKDRKFTPRPTSNTQGQRKQ